MGGLVGAGSGRAGLAGESLAASTSCAKIITITKNTQTRPPPPTKKGKREENQLPVVL